MSKIDQTFVIGACYAQYSVDRDCGKRGPVPANVVLALFTKVHPMHVHLDDETLDEFVMMRSVDGEHAKVRVALSDCAECRERLVSTEEFADAFHAAHAGSHITA